MMGGTLFFDAIDVLVLILRPGQAGLVCEDPQSIPLVRRIGMTPFQNVNEVDDMPLDFLAPVY